MAGYIQIVHQLRQSGIEVERIAASGGTDERIHVYPSFMKRGTAVYIPSVEEVRAEFLARHPEYRGHGLSITAPAEFFLSFDAPGKFTEYFSDRQRFADYVNGERIYRLWDGMDSYPLQPAMGVGVMPKRNMKVTTCE
ncbi:MAG: hypothetical protein HY519_01690 [Candidatus Aenigmarchaeota archaeon]|nr:hypothetical protein [Candidatus Aenigmarchaeota archaeon]